MALRCLAGRLSLHSVFVLYLLLFYLCCQGVLSFLTYDRQTLLEIGDFCNQIKPGLLESSPPPPCLEEIPAFLRRPPLYHACKRRRRRRGKRGGVRVRFEAILRTIRVLGRWTELYLLDDAVLHSRVFRDRWIRPVFPDAGGLGGVGRSVDPDRLVLPPASWRVPTRRRGVDRRNLRSLKHVLSASDTLILNLALLNVRSVTNKTFLLNDLFTARNLDFMFLTETWLREGDLAPLSELLPPGCNYFNSPRITGKGGGLTSIFKSTFCCQQSSTAGYSSFELQLFEVKLSETFLCAVVYRPPKFNKDFVQDFADFVSGVTLKYDHFLIVGDFNIHVCCENRPLVKDFMNVIDSFNLMQSVQEPTHEKGHILDLVLSYGLDIQITEIGHKLLSDHLPVLFSISVPAPSLSAAPLRRLRVFNSGTPQLFCAIFKDSFLYSLDDVNDRSVDECIAMFDSLCTKILDLIAPMTLKRIKPQKEPWLNESTRALRRTCRQAERKWKKDNLQISRELLQDSLINYQLAVKTAKTEYFSSLVSKNAHKPQVLFNVFDSLVNSGDAVCMEPSSSLCEAFLQFFRDKISAIRIPLSRSAQDPSVPLASTAVFDSFEPVCLSELNEIVAHLRPANCQTDSIPSCLFKEVFCSVESFILKFINLCLSSGCVPSSFKHAIVQPLLKKKNLDPLVLSNFRPISKLPFISKVLERAVLIQVQEFLKTADICEQFQSGFRSRHSTETALLKVFNDLFLHLDTGSCAILILLDLTAAFDTVDHKILLWRLEHCVGLKGTVLKWFESYLTDRSISVQMGQFSSSVAPLTCGVPQGSVLGPLLFTLYMLPLGFIFRKHGISFHCFADDVQVYLPLKVPAKESLQAVINCMSDIKTWMDLNFLKLNENKTEVVLFGRPELVQVLASSLGQLAPHLRSHARNLGVIVDSAFKLDKQVSAVVKSSFFQLRLIAKVKPYLRQADLEKVIHVFITSRLDYCNSLYTGIGKSELYRLQLVQNAAARLLSGRKKREHITPVLSSLHWLPVKYRIDFKVILFVFKCINGLAPEYLTDLVRLHRPSRDLRSASLMVLEVPRSKLRSSGDRAFSVAAPTLWNSLPVAVRTASSLSTFKSLLKTHLFEVAFGTGEPP